MVSESKIAIEYLTPNQVKINMIQSLLEKEHCKLRRLLKEVIDTQNCIDSLDELLATYGER